MPWESGPGLDRGSGNHSPRAQRGPQLRELGGDYLGLDRFAEAKAVREKQVAANLDAVSTMRDLYALAFLEGDTAAMQRQVDWAKGKPDEFDFLQVVAEAAASREGYRPGQRKLPPGS